MKEFNNFLMDEDGMGVVEVILIIVILISLALLFKEQITDLVDKILQKITKQAGVFIMFFLAGSCQGAGAS